ncbi:MAG: sigma-70 family RNA polymerase sigma factor [Vicinamibacterales bacterium]
MLSLIWAVIGPIVVGSGRAAGPGEGPPSDHESDLVIIGRMAAGERDAVAELYDRHARAVYSLTFRVLRDQSDAEDVVQEVFAQAWRSASRYDRTRGVVVAWLLMIAKSRAIDRLRARRGIAERANDDVLARVPDPSAAPESLAVTRDETSRLRHALGALPLLQRTAIELAFFEGLSHSEVAERLEQPLGTVKTRIRLGLLKLREAMAGGGV